MKLTSKGRYAVMAMADLANTNANHPTKDNLRPIVNQLYQLLPNPKEGIGQPDEDVLVK